MKQKYSISYFVILTALVFALILAFAMNTTKTVDEIVEIESYSEEEIVNSNSDDIISEGFYLYVEDGYVIIYLYDQSTLFEKTDILWETLPEIVKEEVYLGKYVETTEELYAFLENYSS